MLCVSQSLFTQQRITNIRLSMQPSSVKISLWFLEIVPNFGLDIRYSYALCNVSTTCRLAKVLVQPNVKDMNNVGRRTLNTFEPIIMAYEYYRADLLKLNKGVNKYVAISGIGR